MCQSVYGVVWYGMAHTITHLRMHPQGAGGHESAYVGHVVELGLHLIDRVIHIYIYVCVYRVIGIYI